MNIRKTSETGGVISDPKYFVAVFAVILWEKTVNFWKKGGGITPIRKACSKKAQHSFPKRGRGGGGLKRPFGVFPKIHSNLESDPP